METNRERNRRMLVALKGIAELTRSDEIGLEYKEILLDLEKATVLKDISTSLAAIADVLTKNNKE